MSPPLLPLVLIAGYLGAGKTTLVNHLLRNAQGRRVAVLVNDFGSVNIDAELIAPAAAQDVQSGVLSLTGGCLCCSFGDDLVGTLNQLASRQPMPDVCLVELSGVALPAGVARTAKLAPAVRLVGTLVLADAEHVQRQASDPYVGDTVRQQLQHADWVLLSKADLVTPEHLQACAEWLRTAAPQARAWSGRADSVSPELVLGWAAEAESPVALPGTDPAPGSAFAPRAWGPADPSGHQAAALFESRSHVLPSNIDLPALAACLAAPDSGVLRAKAVTAGQVLQVAGGRWSVEDGPARSGPPVLVLIGLRGQWRPDALLAACCAN